MRGLFAFLAYTETNFLLLPMTRRTASLLTLPAWGELSHLLKFTRTGGVHLTPAGRAFLLPRFERQGLDVLACTNLPQLKACFKQLRRAERAELARKRHFDRKDVSLGFENLRFLEIMLTQESSAAADAQQKRVDDSGEPQLGGARIVSFGRSRKVNAEGPGPV